MALFSSSHHTLSLLERQQATFCYTYSCFKARIQHGELETEAVAQLEGLCLPVGQCK